MTHQRLFDEMLREVGLGAPRDAPPEPGPVDVSSAAKDIQGNILTPYRAITHGSQDYPWGVLLGFGLFGMVPLSASGFLLSTTVHIFQRDDFRPIERLALLNGLLGYFFAVVYLEVDLGMPWRLPYPMFVSLGPAAVLFLVAWHVATYLSVQVGELIPAFAEWIGWPWGKKFIKKIALALTIAGIILSTLIILSSNLSFSQTTLAL